MRRTFSGNPTATPLYDYNQMMYRLDLSTIRCSSNAKLPGDFNHDGQVDGQDLLIWQEAYGDAGSGIADADGDGDCGWSRLPRMATEPSRDHRQLQLRFLSLTSILLATTLLACVADMKKTEIREYSQQLWLTALEFND